MKVSVFAILTSIILALFTTASHSTTVAINSINAGGSGLSTGSTVIEGFHFRPNQDIFVQELGYFDSFSDGLIRSYSMGIVATDDTILASTIVPAGTAGRLGGPTDPGGSLAGSRYRFASLDSPLALDAGVTYAVVALFTPGPLDPIPLSPAFTTDGAITFLGGFFNLSGVTGLGFPDDFPSTALAVNFTFTTELNAVPLPAALPLYGTGLAIMGFIGWRRRQQQVA